MKAGDERDKREQIEVLKQSIAAVKAQRSMLGNTVVDAALVPMRGKLA
jgi:hypothetical protein